MNIENDVFSLFYTHKYVISTVYYSDHDNVRSELDSITGQLDSILSNLNIAKKAAFSNK